MSRPHYYDGLDKDSRLEVSLSTREAAERIVEMNHGTHRFLSHLIDVRRERLRERIQRYRDRGDNDIADSVERRGDELADGIEALLNGGLF